MSVALHLLSGPLDDAARGALIFDGGLLVFHQMPAVRAFAVVTDNAIRQALGDDPAHAHRRLEPEALRDTVTALQRDYRKDPAVRGAFIAVLDAAGVDGRAAYWDWLALRVQPPRDEKASATLGVHRDTWSSAVDAQSNWWTPIYEIGADRTVAFYPAYWTRSVANTSADWDLDQPRGRPLVPKPSESVDTGGELRMVLQPGDLLCFSGAQLHASVPNTSDMIRFSVEVRTVHLDDVRHGRGAPNIDGSAPRTAWRWFTHPATGASLDDVVGGG